MANRRLLDSRHHAVVASPNSYHHHGTYFQSRLLFITLAIVASCLTGTNCTSFARRSANQQQWNDQPDYRLFTGGAIERDGDPNNLFGPPAISLSYRQQNGRQSLLDSQQSPDYYYFVSQPSRSLSDTTNNPQQFEHQIVLPRQLILDNRQQLITSDPPSPLSNYYSSKQQQLDQLDYPANFDSFATSNESPDYTTRLVELLRRADKKLEHSSHVSALGNTETSFSHGVDDDEASDDFYRHLTDPKSPLFYLNPSDRSQETSGKFTFGQRNELPSSQNSATNDGHANYVYHVDGDDKSIGVGGDSEQQQQKQTPDGHRNLTTLIEDDVESVVTPAPSSTINDHETTTPTINSTSPGGAGVATTTISYGTIITGAPAIDSNNKDGSSFSRSPSKSSLAMFSEMYMKLANYLASFMTQVSDSPSAGSSEQLAKKNNSTKLLAADNDDDKLIDNKNKESSFKKMIRIIAGGKNQANTKPSVSGTTIEPSKTSTGNDGTATTSDDDNNSIVRDNDKLMKNEKSDNKFEQLYGSSSFDDGVFMNGELDSSKIGMNIQSDTSNDNINFESDAKKRLALMNDGENNGPRVSLARQSNLVMPFKSNDELVDQVSGQYHPTSLFGNYMYGQPLTNPENGLKKSKSLDVDDEQQIVTHMAHRSFSRRLHPGDDEIYGSYSGLRPLYASQRTEGPISLVANKSNDVYFLVMVAAFCAMAMAVVLAAGLFAYRVQQSRKSSSEVDYPTYGVVGPNNVSGKCGAASFGYFGAPGPGSGQSVSRAGSAKHLTDVYSGASDSGVISTGKSTNKKTSSDQSSTRSNFVNQDAARMYHYQHQKQQMIISDRNSTGRHTSASDLDSEDENDDGSYTVYECPGLASAHEMEIKNPLFNDDHTP